MYSIRDIFSVKTKDCWVVTIDFLPQNPGPLYWSHTEVIEVRGLTKKIAKKRAKIIIKALNKRLIT